MKNFDFCIAGNIFVDNVQITNSFSVGASNLGISTRDGLGGTFNTAKNLCEIDSTSNVFLSTTIGHDAQGLYTLENLNQFKRENKGFDYHAHYDGDKTTTALIICETEKNIRSSIVNWGACKHSDKFLFPKSKWYHFMYLDTAHGITEEIFKKVPKGSIISADFCLSSHSDEEKRRIMKMMKYVDYAILSEDSANSIADQTIEIYSAMEIGERVKKAAIVHTPKGSFVSSEGQEFMCSSEYIDDVKMDVLGAGDAFAASFIYNTSKNRDNLKDNVEWAHKFATGYIQGDR
jgi:sugar/nucleoside kinase (ribokinase family)